MNENHVENLLSRHGDEILTRRTVKQAKRKQAWKPIFATGTIVVAVGAFLLLPNNADAARIMKVKNAMKNVRSMDIKVFVRTNYGSWRLGYRNLAQKNVWRTDAEKGSGLKVVYLADRTHEMRNYENLPFITISHHSTEYWQREYQGYFDNPLKIALFETTGTNTPGDFTISTHAGLPREGQSTYILEYKQASIGRVTKITVNSETDLPIESSSEDDYRGAHNEVRTEYRFDQKIDPALFSFKTSKPVIDVQAGQEALKISWVNHTTISGVAPIYSTSVTPDGNIWIAYGVKSSAKRNSAPSEVTNAGKEYVLAHEIPMSFGSYGRDFRLFDNEIIIAMFVPVYDVGLLPETVDIRFGSRIELNGTSTGKVEKVFASPVLRSMKVQRESMPIPQYLPIFGFDREYLSIESKTWEKRAIALEGHGDVAGAAKAFERSGHAWEKFVVYMGYKPFRESARCYEKLGQVEKAKELRSMADKLYESRIR